MFYYLINHSKLIKFYGLFYTRDWVYCLWGGRLKVNFYWLRSGLNDYLLQRSETFPAFVFKGLPFFLRLFEIVFFMFLNICEVWKILHNDKVWELTTLFFVLFLAHLWIICLIFISLWLLLLLGNFILFIVIKNKDVGLLFLYMLLSFSDLGIIIKDYYLFYIWFIHFYFDILWFNISIIEHLKIKGYWLTQVK